MLDARRGEARKETSVPHLTGGGHLRRFRLVPCPLLALLHPVVHIWSAGRLARRNTEHLARS